MRKPYKTASYRRNVLEFKARQQNDLQAKAELPKAQEEVEELQKKLKEAQSALARATGAADPHAKRRASRPAPVQRQASHGRGAQPRQSVGEFRSTETLLRHLSSESVRRIIDEKVLHYKKIPQGEYIQRLIILIPGKVTPLKIERSRILLRS